MQSLWKCISKLHPKSNWFIENYYTYHQKYEICKAAETRFVSSSGSWVENNGPRCSVVDHKSFKQIFLICIYYCMKDSFQTEVIRELMRMEEAFWAKLTSKIEDFPKVLSLNTRDCSSKVYCSYISISMHWVKMLGTLRDSRKPFLNFSASYNRNMIRNVLLNTKLNKKITAEIKPVSTNNNFKNLKGQWEKNNHLNGQRSLFNQIKDVRVLFIAHAVNLSLKLFPCLMHLNIASIRLCL